MERLTAADARELLLYVADRVIESKPYLTEMDRAIGDGDHGIGMALGMGKARETLQTLEGCSDVYRLFCEAGMAMMMSMGGASGVIFGTLFSGGAKGRSPSPALDCAAFTELVAGGLSAVQRRGGAHVGDKTMVDALQPAVEAMEAFPGNDFCGLLGAAEEAARAGAESTRNLVARFGRAKSLGERALGHMDAGAASTHIIFRAMRDFCVRRGGQEDGK